MADVLVIGTIRPEGLAVFEGRRDIRLTKLAETDRAGLLDAAGRASAILVRTSRVDRAVIEAAPGLKVVSRHGVGYDNVDLAALNARRIPLAVAASANMISVAEHAIFMMLELAKAGRAHDRAVRADEWTPIRKRVLAFEPYERRLLIVGLGRIGRQVARRAQGFGMRTVAIDPHVAEGVFAAHGCERVEDLDRGLAEADIVSLHLPLSEATRNLIDGRRLGLMKPDALLINTARGGLIDEQALARALRDGTIGGAGIDVLEAEPPPADHPLFGLENVLLSPHNAGVTTQSMKRMGSEAAANIAAVLDGRLDPAVIVNHAEVTAR